MMKRNIIVATFLILAGSLVAQPQQWFEVASGTNKKMNVVDFPSANVGYIGGNDSLLLKTTDGGKTWIPLNYSGVTFFPNEENIVNLKFVNELVGFMTVGPYSGVYKTINGGVSWTLVQNLNTCFNQGLFFFDENNGFVGGSGCFQGEMIERLSGGVWTTATINTPTWDAENLIVDIDFSDPNFGLAASHSGYILRTTDGGLNWDTIPSPAGMQNPITSVLILNGTTALAGYVSAMTGFGMYITTDAGLTWQEDMNSATFLYPDFLCLHQSQNGRVFSGGSSQSMNEGVIFEVSDDLSDWTYSLVDHSINSIDGYYDSVVFAVGDSGYILVNVDLAVLNVNENQTLMENVVIYPNPVSDILHISASPILSEENARIRIVSLNGEVVLEQVFTPTLDLREFQTGIYILEIESGNVISREKISKF